MLSTGTSRPTQQLAYHSMSKEHDECAGSEDCNMSLVASCNNELRAYCNVLSSIIEAETVSNLADIDEHQAATPQAHNLDAIIAVFRANDTVGVKLRADFLNLLVYALKHSMALITESAASATVMQMSSSPALILVRDLSFVCRTIVRELMDSKTSEDKALLEQLLQLIYSGTAVHRAT